MLKETETITIKTLDKMNERIKLNQRSNIRDVYNKLFREVQRQYRLTKENHYNTMCEEMEELDRKLSPKLYARTKDLQQKKP